ncbi:MAG: cell division ATP-binding protein FtsE [Bacillota bacterium]
MIQLIDVWKAYPNEVVALKEINLKIDRGDFVFIVGPSGAGKSTLIRLLYREETATRGQVLVHGKNVARLRRSSVPLLRRTIGVIFQDFKLLPDRSAHDNVAFALEVTEAPRREVKRRVPAVLELVGLKDRARAFPHELSGGEKQRVAIARAIVNGPSILVADEPTGNLDPDTSWGIMNLLQTLNRNGATVIMATHAKNIVNAMKKRVVAMDHGLIIRDQEQGVYAHEVN